MTVLCRGLAQVDDDELPVGHDQHVLALVAVGGDRARVGSPHPPVAAVVEAAGRTARRVVRRRVVGDEGAAVVGPAHREDPVTRRGQPVAAVQLAEPREVAGGRVHVRRADPRAGTVELGPRRLHPSGLEQPLTQEALHPVPPAADGVAEDSADDVGGPGRVVPLGAGLVVERERGCVGRVVVGAVTEQHRDAVGDLAVDVVLDEARARSHLEQVEEGDPLLGGATPRRHGCRRVEVEPAAGDEDADGGVGHRRRGAPRHEGRVDVEADCGAERRLRSGSVPLGDDLTTMHDDHRERDPEVGRPIEARVHQRLDHPIDGTAPDQHGPRPSVGRRPRPIATSVRSTAAPSSASTSPGRPRRVVIGRSGRSTCRDWTGRVRSRHRWPRRRRRHAGPSHGAPA
jgi:hypothetical protein